jgi:hypothetical protein
MEATLRQHLTWPNLRKDVEDAVKNCHECQKGKKLRKKYGDLPEKLAEGPIAWNRVDVDLIGLLKIKTPSGNYHITGYYRLPFINRLPGNIESNGSFQEKMNMFIQCHVEQSF